MQCEHRNVKQGAVLMSIQQTVAVKSIVPAKDNSRKVTDKSVEELAASIRAVGLLQPVVIRRLGEGYELMAGHRRLRAYELIASEITKQISQAKKAKDTDTAKGLEKLLAQYQEIPVSIVDADDQTAQGIRVTENLQRADLTPMEEADAIGKLFKEGRTVQEIASELGKSPQFVAKRSQLLKLSPKWRKAMKSNEELENWPVANYELIARYDTVRQDEILADIGFYAAELSPSDLQDRLSQDDKRLSSTAWDVADAGLLPKAGACSTCEKRSGCQPLLFDDYLTKGNEPEHDDRCLDDQCWKDKRKAYLVRRVEETKDEHPNMIYIDDYGRDKPKVAVPGPVHKIYDMKFVEKPGKNIVPALYISGNKLGQVTWAQTGHSGTGSKSKPKPMKNMTDAERAKVLDGRRTMWIVKKLQEVVEETRECKGLKPGATHGYTVKSATERFQHALAFAISFGVDTNRLGNIYDAGKLWGRLNRIKPLDVEELLMKFWTTFRGNLEVQLMQIVNSGVANATKSVAVLQNHCLLLDVDFYELQEESVEAVKRPKSWPPEGEPKKIAKSKPKKKTASPKKKTTLKGKKKAGKRAAKAA